MQIIADCEGGLKRYQIIDAYFKNQAVIFESARSPQGALPTLIDIANKTTGISGDKVKACITDKSKVEAIQRSEDGAIKMGIDSTPTILIDGKILKLAPTQSLGIDTMKPTLDKAIAAKTRKKK
jgi:protein-disulfide isomerase